MHWQQKTCFAKRKTIDLVSHDSKIKKSMTEYCGLLAALT